MAVLASDPYFYGGAWTADADGFVNYPLAVGEIECSERLLDYLNNFLIR